MTDTASTHGGLDDRVVVVTGAGQGLGRAFAHRLAESGARVVVADLDGARAASVAQEIGEAGLAVEVDVSDEASVAALFARVDEACGRLDVLVNNAAVFSTLRMGPFEEITVDEWDHVMAVNVRGPFLCSRAAAPLMRRTGGGKIVNISSATVFMGRPNYLHYVTSKAAVIGMTRALAAELGPHGITVNALAPGSTETEIPRETVTPEQAARIVAGQAIGRRQVPDDLAGVVVFLASPASDFMTGQTMNVDGGAAFH
jgi:3-oxoacyl-[acyl-carrier protein] reductase